MEHPVFSVSTKPDFKTRRYAKAGKHLKVIPSGSGIATVHDRDVLIFCISQIMAALNEGQQVSQTVRFKAFDLLVATNRPTGGESYTRLRSAFERLRGTTIETNITSGSLEVLDGFGLIESYRIVRETRDGRMQEVEVKLSDWVFSAIRQREVLTLHRDYFRLRKPLERRIYEIARKHCGSKTEWKIGLARLQEKSGSGSTAKEFRRLVKTIVSENEKHHHIPDYDITLEADTDIVRFTNRQTMPAPSSKSSENIVQLSPDAYHDARSAAPGWDVHFLEQEWRNWSAMSDAPIRNADGAFIGFCRRWFERKGQP